jgi:hypothetical protein
MLEYKRIIVTVLDEPVLDKKVSQNTAQNNKY